MPEKREDVEVTPQQDTAPDTSQQKKKWRAIDWIAGGTFIAEVLWGSWWLVTQFFQWCTWNPKVSAEHFAQFYCGVGLGILSVGYLTLILWPIIFNIFKQGKDSKQDNDPRWFHARILSSGIVGGSYAFLLPAVMSLPEGGINSGGAAALRQAILLATGGLIALIALGETRRKNDNDKRKNDQEKEKNDRDHLRQVRAERRERYTKAVEQLGSQEAPVRMGGVYTLVGLVDEWLEEKSLSDDERFKEGQVIINNLCAYIRSPFTLTSYYDELSENAPSLEGIYKDKKEEFYVDKAILDSEADVRLSIIKEIHDRIQGPDKNTPGAWSDFEYDFSGSTFFYPIDLRNSYYAKPINFSGSTYQGWADFSRSTYQGWADFSHSTYRGRATFNGSTYRGRATFNGSTYQGLATFNGSTYQGLATFNGSTYRGRATFSHSTYQSRRADFNGSTYRGRATFNGSTYQGWATFSHSTYKGGADFNGSTYRGRATFNGSTYQGWATFSHSTYKGLATFNGSTYRGRATFNGSTYRGRATFSHSTYKGLATFNGSTYRGRATFNRSTYQYETDFSGSIFYQEVYFGEDEYNSFSFFTDCAPQFYDETNRKNTLFGSHNNDFTVDIDKGYPIDLDSKGIPLGCKFLTSEQKEYLADKFQEIEETNNKLLEVKDPIEKEELLKKLRSLNEELHEWREEATTVKAEDTAPEEKNN